jgi:rhomboid family GlyGly-CTERM serine protease
MLEARIQPPNPMNATLAKPRSAELHSAVSQNCILRNSGESQRLGTFPHPADFKSAIQQSATLRYVGKARPETGVFLFLLLFLNWPLVQGGVLSSLVFTPASVAAGEWWRVVTHPFVHVSWYHLLLDAGAFIALYESLRETSAWRRLGYVAAAGLGSLGLSWLATPALSQTGLCGLSGIAHGLTAVTALELISTRNLPSTERRIGWLTLLLVMVKAAWEAVTGQAFLSFLHFGLMGAPVAVSHAGGILGAVAMFCLLRAGPARGSRCPESGRTP